MDFSLTEQQEMLRKSAREFLEKECPKKLVRDMEEDPKGYSPELWKKMAELGWQGLVFPDKYGGSDLNFLDLVILIEEMGRALAPGPFLPTVVYGGLPIAAAGTEEQKKQFLPGIAKGDMILTLALTEPEGSYDAAGITAKATAQGDDYIINGSKLFVPDVHIANYLICVARTKDGAAKEDGITLFLVDAKSQGISCSPLKTIANDRQFEVTFDQVRVPRKNILGQVDKGWDIVKRIIDESAVALSAWMLGAAQQALEMTVAYSKERVQFGKPIGGFQALQFQMADMVIDADGSRNITYQAAWKLSEGHHASKEASMAKAWTNNACQRVCFYGHKIHGGIGFTKDHDMGLFFRRVSGAELTFGTASYHQALVAKELGL